MKVKLYLHGVVLPLIMITLILVAEIQEGSKAAYIGILASVPPLAAVFGTVRMVVAISIIAWSAAFIDGIFFSYGNEMVQRARLMAILIISLMSIAAARIRARNERRMLGMVIQIAKSEAIERHSKLDYLTGHANRHGIASRIAQLNSGTRTVVMFDFDKFKWINDELGHKVGDDFIVSVSGRLAADFKQEDIFGRWGGDEFVAVLELPEAKAFSVIKRVIASACSSPVVISNFSLPVKVSAGVAEWRADQTFEQALVRADKALYQAKEQGGCQVVRFQELPDKGGHSPHAH